MRISFVIITAILLSEVFHAQAQEPFKISGELRVRGEVRDNADFNADRLDGTAQVFNRLRLGFLRNLGHGLAIFAQLQDSRIWGEEGSSLTALNKVDLHQAYLQLDQLAGLPLSIHLGRQKLSFGSERLVSEFDWDNVSRSFDALNVRWGKEQQNLHLWLAQVRDQNAPTVARNQEFGGAFFSTEKLLPATLEAYLLVLHDARNFESVADPASPGDQDEPANTLTMYTAGARLNGELAQRFHYDLEGAYQTGNRGFSDIRAYGVAFDASYTLAERWSPKIHAGYVFGSGDSDPNDSKSETFANLFPDVHRYLGAMDYASWSNLAAVYLGLSFAPQKSLAMGANWHLLSLATDNDVWYRGGGFNIGTPQEIYRQAVPGAGQQLGHEFDLYFSYLYQQRLNLSLGLSKLFVGEFIENTGGLQADDSIWAYLSVAVEF